MPFELEDIVEFKIFQNFQGQQVLNVMNYIVSATPPTAFAPANVVGGFSLQWFEQARTVQAAGVSYVRGELTILGKEDLGVFAFAPGQLGELAGDALPPYCSYGIRLNRSSRATRNGQKRIAGVTEAQTLGGTLTAAAVTAVTNAFIPLVRAPINVEDNSGDDTGVIFDPIIFGEFLPLPPFRRFSFVDGITVSPNVSTQNTRKVRTRDGL